MATSCACLAAVPGRAQASKFAIEVEVPPVAAGTSEGFLQTQFGLSPDEAKRIGPTLDQQINALLPDVRDDFLQQVQKAFGGLDSTGLLRAMADATGGAGKLLSSDYATDAAVGSLSAGVGAAAKGWSRHDIDHLSIDASTGELPERGLGVTAGGALTFHLRTLSLPRWRFFDPSRLTVGVNFMTFGPTALGDKVTLGFSSWGVRAAYQVLDGHSWARHGLARWGGLHVGLGVARSTMDLRVRASLPAVQSVDQTVQGSVPLDLRLVYGGDADITLQLGAWNVPLEVYSHLQLGYLFTLFGGLGLDVNRSTAALSGDVNSSNLALEVVNRDDPSVGTKAISYPTAKLDADDAARGRVVDARGFFGVQVNLLYAAVFAQASLDTTRTLGVNAGLRVFY